MQEVSEELNIPIIVSQTSIKKSASYRTLREYVPWKGLY
jgi:hypothetical protein